MTSIDSLQTALKLHTIVIVALLIITLIVIGNCYNVFAETTIITANDAETSIQIMNEDSMNVILFQNENGISTHYESKMKQYKNGFSMKNLESGILVFGHKISMSQYKLVIITSEKVYRLIGFVDVLEEIQIDTIKEKPEIVTEKIEPKSSIGSDVSKWNVPTHNPRDATKTMLLTIKGDTIQSLNLGDDYEKTFRVLDSRTNQKLVGIDVALEIVRDDFIYKSVNVKTSTGGMAHFEIKDLDYPLFYPKFCYDVTITATFGNVTATWKDDFEMIQSGVWNPNFNWIGEQRWNYLPKSFEFEPRQLINADEHCN